MTHAIDTVFIDAIFVPPLRELGLPETLPLAKVSPRMQKWVLGEAACLQRDPTFALLVEHGDPLTRESYLNVNDVDEDDVDAKQESELPDLFQESMIDERVASVMFEIEIYDTLRQLLRVHVDARRCSLYCPVTRTRCPHFYVFGWALKPSRSHHGRDKANEIFASVFDAGLIISIFLSRSRLYSQVPGGSQVNRAFGIAENPLG